MVALSSAITGLAGSAQSTIFSLGAVARVAGLSAESIEDLAVGAEAAGTVIQGLTGIFNAFVASNIELQDQILQSTAAVVANTQVFDEWGKKIESVPDQFRALQPKYKQLIKEIQQDTLELVGVTSQDVNNAFNIVSSNISQIVGQSKKISDPLKAVKELAVGITAAAGTFQLPADQISQEITSILTGQVTSDTRLGALLNITNQELERARAAGELVDYVLGRFERIKEAQAVAATTVSGSMSNIIDTFQISFREAGEFAVKPLEDGLLNLYKNLRDNQEDFTAGLRSSFKSIVDGLGGIVKIGTLVFKVLEYPLVLIGNTLKTFTIAAFDGFTILGELAQNLIDTLKPLGSIIAEGLNFGGNALKDALLDPLAAFQTSRAITTGLEREEKELIQSQLDQSIAGEQTDAVQKLQRGELTQDDTFELDTVGNYLQQVQDRIKLIDETRFISLNSQRAAKTVRASLVKILEDNQGFLDKNGLTLRVTTVEALPLSDQGSIGEQSFRRVKAGENDLNDIDRGAGVEGGTEQFLQRANRTFESLPIAVKTGTISIEEANKVLLRYISSTKTDTETKLKAIEVTKQLADQERAVTNARLAANDARNSAKVARGEISESEAGLRQLENEGARLEAERESIQRQIAAAQATKVDVDKAKKDLADVSSKAASLDSNIGSKKAKGLDTSKEQTELKELLDRKSTLEESIELGSKGIDTSELESKLEEVTSKIDKNSADLVNQAAENAVSAINKVIENANSIASLNRSIRSNSVSTQRKSGLSKGDAERIKLENEITNTLEEQEIARTRLLNLENAPVPDTIEGKRQRELQLNDARQASVDATTKLIETELALQELELRRVETRRNLNQEYRNSTRELSQLDKEGRQIEGLQTQSALLDNINKLESARNDLIKSRASLGLLRLQNEIAQLQEVQSLQQKLKEEGLSGQAKQEIQLQLGQLGGSGLDQTTLLTQIVNKQVQAAQKQYDLKVLELELQRSSFEIEQRKLEIAAQIAELEAKTKVDNSQGKVLDLRDQRTGIQNDRSLTSEEKELRLRNVDRQIEIAQRGVQAAERQLGLTRENTSTVKELATIGRESLRVQQQSALEQAANEGNKSIREARLNSVAQTSQVTQQGTSQPEKSLAISPELGSAKARKDYMGVSGGAALGVQQDLLVGPDGKPLRRLVSGGTSSASRGANLGGVATEIMAKKPIPVTIVGGSGLGDVNTNVNIPSSVPNATRENNAAKEFAKQMELARNSSKKEEKPTSSKTSVSNVVNNNYYPSDMVSRVQNRLNGR